MTLPMRFNPRLAGDRELAETVVAREPQTERLVADLTADVERGVARHFLVIAPSGTGKTTLCEQVARRLTGWRVVRLPEEPWAVATVGDLLLAVVQALDGDDPFADESDPSRMEELALDRVRAAGSEGPPVLVLLENLDLVLERLVDRDQKRLRQVLMRNPPFRILATSALAPPGTSRHEAAFYDFFQIIVLPELERDGAQALVDARARWDGVPPAPQAARSLDLLWPWIGGNPRRLLTWYTGWRADPTADGTGQLLALLDALTPHHQRRMRGLSPQMARVLHALATGERLATPALLGRRLRLPTNQVTANLTRLEAERLARPGARPDGRSRWWEVADPLLRAWLVLRDGGRERLKPWVDAREPSSPLRRDGPGLARQWAIERDHADPVLDAAVEWFDGGGAALHPEERTTLDELLGERPAVPS